MITYLTKPDGTQATTPHQLADTLVQYFTDIFTTQNTPTRVLSPPHNNPTRAQTYSQPDPLPTPTSAQPTDHTQQDQQTPSKEDTLRYTYSTLICRKSIALSMK